MLRRLIADLTPPLLFRPARRLYHRLRRRDDDAPRPMFEGRYPSLQAVPCGTDRYDDETYAAGTAARAMEPLMLPGGYRDIVHPTGRHLILPLVAAPFANGPLTVLDDGGGACLGLFELLDLLPTLDLAQFRYVNVETPAMCRSIREPVETLLRSRFNTSSFARITDDIPDSLQSPSIVNIASSLEYISDYGARLSKLASLGPEFFIISFMPVSDKPTYACQQLLRDRLLAMRVFNRAELISEMRRLGYGIVFTVTHAIALTFANPPGPFSIASMVFRREAIASSGRIDKERPL